MKTKRSKQFDKGRYALPRLFDIANKYNKKALASWCSYLENARKSGEALVKARSYFPMRSRGWKKYIEDHFDASYETAKVYMRIARKWDDPRLKEARKKGFVNSIRGFLRVLDYQQLEDGDTNEEIDFARYEIRKMFAEKLLSELSKDDIEIFAQDDVFDYLWDRLYAELRNVVCRELGYDPYRYEKHGGKFYLRYKQEAKAERETWKKVQQALNRSIHSKTRQSYHITP